MKSQVLILLRIPYMWVVFLLLFLRFLLSLCLLTVWLWCVEVCISSLLSCLEFLELLRCANQCLSLSWGSFRPFYLQIFFLHLSLLSDCHYGYVGVLEQNPISLQGFVHFPSFFFVAIPQLRWSQSICFQVCWFFFSAS